MSTSFWWKVFMQHPVTKIKFDTVDFDLEQKLLEWETEGVMPEQAIYEIKHMRRSVVQSKVLSILSNENTTEGFKACFNCHELGFLLFIKGKWSWEISWIDPLDVNDYVYDKGD